MEAVTVSSKYQIVIPRGVRQSLCIKPGRRLVVIEKEGHIHLVPIGTISSTRGIARGASLEGLREKKDRI